MYKVCIKSVLLINKTTYVNMQAIKNLNPIALKKAKIVYNLAFLSAKGLICYTSCQKSLLKEIFSNTVKVSDKI